MRVDSCSECCCFESQHRILDEHFFILICCKILLMFAWKRPKINEKEAGDDPFYKKKQDKSSTYVQKILKRHHHRPTFQKNIFETTSIWFGIRGTRYLHELATLSDKNLLQYKHSNTTLKSYSNNVVIYSFCR